MPKAVPTPKPKRKRRPGRADSRLPAEGDPRRYVYVDRAACSHCGAKRLRVYATKDDGEVLMQWSLCRECGGEMIVVAE
jgi:hypothetical protein